MAERYSAAAEVQEPALRCPVQYRQEYLDAIPQEILDRDYGCGDPSPYVREGEIVLDLGSGAGKVCYILSQVVGPEGRVIGVDCNREMIGLARRYREEVAGRIGFANVEFRYGLIQDLALDLEQLAEETRGLEIETPQDWLDLRRVEQRLRREPYLRFVIRRMPGGAVSEWLATRVPGDEIELSSPFGWFRPGYGGEPGDPSVLIATGTGIAPFLSALRSLPDLVSSSSTCGCTPGIARTTAFLYCGDSTGCTTAIPRWT